MDADKSISPVDALMLNPAVELNVPPVVPDIVGVGSLPDTQYSADAYVNCLLSTSPSPRARTRCRMPSSG